MKHSIDINCDMGEGLNNEDLLMPYISSCSIACGGHAGDEHTMEKVSLMAQEKGVKIGAHPSYPDKMNFGRKSVNMPLEELRDSIRDQIQTLETILKINNLKLHHIKAHGALYNDLAKDKSLAKFFLETVSGYKESTFLYVPYGSEIYKMATQEGFKIKAEAFADRNYNADMTLVSRTLPNAILNEPHEVLEHVLRIIFHQNLKTVQGHLIGVKADTICVHSDTVKAKEILKHLSLNLKRKGISIE